MTAPTGEITPAAAPETVLEGDTESGAVKGRSRADRPKAAAPDKPATADRIVILTQAHEIDGYARAVCRAEGVHS
jgi:hypothetical protein